MNACGEIRGGARRVEEALMVKAELEVQRREKGHGTEICASCSTLTK